MPSNALDTRHLGDAELGRSSSTDGVTDNTRLSVHGATQMTALVVRGIRE